MAGDFRSGGAYGSARLEQVSWMGRLREFIREFLAERDGRNQASLNAEVMRRLREERFKIQQERK